MEYFFIGLIVGLFSGVALAALVVTWYSYFQNKEPNHNITVDEINEMLRVMLVEPYELPEERTMEMDNDVPLVATTKKEQPIAPSSVGDAEVRHRAAVVHENDQ